MLSVGRYASPLQAKCVQDFFSGNLSLAQFADEYGDVRVSLADLTSAGLVSADDALFFISHYFTDVTSSDWYYRAFIWGSSGFRLSDETEFVLHDGSFSLENACLVPRNDDFNWDGSSDYVDFVNSYIFEPLVDPYGIGRTVEFIFDQSGLDAWKTANGKTITADDFASYVSPAVTFANPALAAVTATLAVGQALAGSNILMQEIRSALEYVKDGHNIVYGSYNADALSVASGKGESYDPSLPNIYVAGEGSDTVTLTRVGDVVYAGAGDDLVHSVVQWQEGDPVGGEVQIYLEGGTDRFVFDPNSDSETLLHIRDSDVVDSIQFGEHVMTGGRTVLDTTKTVVVQQRQGGPGWDNPPFPGGPGFPGGPSFPSGQLFSTIKADEHAVYRVRAADSDGQESDVLEMAFTSGHRLKLDEYVDGSAGIASAYGGFIITQDIGKALPAKLATVFPDEGAMYQGLHSYQVVYESPWL